MSEPMIRNRVATFTLFLTLISAVAVDSDAGDVSGVVRMPDVCSPSISPAVVYLTPIDGRAVAATRESLGSGSGVGPRQRAEVALVTQRGLQFLPRIQTMTVGQSVRFTNQDGETHNVHIVSPGFAFNQSMAPGQGQEFTPAQPGIMRLACDIHHHMRGYVIVSPSPWSVVCDREGHFRLHDVADGHYTLTAWHEMGDPATTEINVAGSKERQLPDLVLTSFGGRTGGAAGQGTLPGATPARPWADVIDQIGVMLAASRDAATRHGELAKARRLVDDAYWGEFESSDMETAVRKYVGFVRAGELERQFTAIRSAAREVAEKRQPLQAMADLSHKLLLDLSATASILDARGVTDGTRIDSVANAAASHAELGGGAPLIATEPTGDPRILLQGLKRGLERVEKQANDNDRDEAASELTTVYMTDFEPLERYLLGRSPQSVRPLEIQFNSLRGALRAGLKGEKLESRIAALASDVTTLIDRLETQPVGVFGPAFLASLVTILREGLEVILVVTMLLALVAKAASGPDAGGTLQGSGSVVMARAAAGAVRAIWWGVGLASLASLGTAVILNALVSATSGAAREILEGVVMLAAAGILFYVSYWLISQIEAKRWIDFLRKQARQGLELGGRGTLAVTAFLAVYREGAETSLMYQALLSSEGRTRAGFVGVIAGLALGVALLAIVARLIQATSVRLPMHLFFKLSGLFLFVLAIVFAGNGVFELQNAGILLTTNLAWMGSGLPWAGLYPNVQVIAVQGLLLAGAVTAWLVVPRSALQPSVPNGPVMSLVSKSR